MRLLTLTVAVAAGLAAAAMAQTVAGVDLARMRASSAQALPAALETFELLLQPQSAEALGFGPGASVARAQVEAPLADFIIGLADLRRYRAGDDPLRILGTTLRMVYPLATGGGRISSVTLVEIDGRWRAASFGSPASARALANTRDRLVRTGIATEDLFQVRIPALNLHFVGHVAGRELVLTPTLADLRHGLAAGQSYAADRVLTALVPVAQNHRRAPG